MTRILSAWLGAVLAALLVLVPVSAIAQPVDGGHARVELVSERAVAVPGETVWLGLSFEMDPNWHIYWLNAGDAGIPPMISWGDLSDVTEANAGAFSWPVPELLPIVAGEIMDYGYSDTDTVVLPFPVEIPDDAFGSFTASGVADYLICEDICIPESVALSLVFDIGPVQLPDLKGSELVQQGLSDVPPALDGEANLTRQGGAWVLSVSGSALAGERGKARFFPETHDIVHAADQPVSFGAAGLQLRLTPDGSAEDLPEQLKGVVMVGDTAFAVTATPGPILAETSGVASGSANLAVLILLALIGGMILNLMPCVLPVLSIKAMGFVSSAASGQSGEIRAHGLWYTAGVLACFGLLAIAILSVRAATGIATWGFWLQDPLVVTALVLILFLIGLWLLGLFELGGSIQNLGGGLAARQGASGAFFTGVLAAIVGAPCTGPFLGAALGAVLGQPAHEVIIVLLAMGFGMALPMLALSFLPGLQARLPKPGAWMETLKQVFAFPMFLTAAWLISVLGALAGYRLAAIVVAGAALIAFGLWAFRTAETGARAILLAVLGLAMIVPLFGLMSVMAPSDAVVPILTLIALAAGFWLVARLDQKRIGQVTTGLAALAIVTGLVWPMAQALAPMPPEGATEAYSTAYPTEAWSPERVAELTAEGRAVFVDFTAEWCATCQANKLQTLQTEAVQAAFERGNVAFLVADYTRPSAEIAKALTAHGRAGVPMYLWYEAGSETPMVLPEILSVGLVTGLVDTG